MLWATSPACTELETLVLDWLVDMLGLPPGFKSASAGGGVLQDTASSATLCALLAAREKATAFGSNTVGLRDPLVAYASTEAHSSVEKAARVAGIGARNLRRIATDERFALHPQALRQALEEDLRDGLRPFFVCATVGTTSSNALDPLPAIGDLCRRHGLWLHVDAAMSGTAALCPEFRFIHEGLELADSYCFNPHKWMLTNFDCDCFYVRDRAALIQTLSLLPEYLRNAATESGAVFDYRDWHIPLGRRFRSLKLWFVIRYYGLQGLQQHVRQHVELARLFKSWVEADPDFEIAAPAPLNLVCFRHRRGDEVNQRILESINKGGRLFLTHTRLKNLFTLRLAIGHPRTARTHIEQAWQEIRSAARQA
jgi:aromatic-L-amino-acid decarboxylase